MSEVDRVLDALLHDFRSPLAAATGYLRLIREKRIAPGPDLERAIEQTQTALRNMSLLCARAEAWRLAPPPARESTEPLRRACDEIVRLLDEQTIAVERDGTPESSALALTSDWAEVCPALVAMLALVARPRPSAPAGTVHIGCTVAALQISVHRAAREESAIRSAFDPWAYPGLVVALGCRAVERCGGSWQADVDDAALRVELPLVTQTAR